MDKPFEVQRIPPHVEVGLIHEPRCTNNLCTCLDGQGVLFKSVVTRAFAEMNRMLNDRELRARVDKMYYDGAMMRDVTGFEWYCDPNPFALYDYVGFLFI